MESIVELSKGKMYVHYDMIKSKWVEDNGENNSAIICQMKFGDLPTKQANAAFIVKCCNGHKELLSALKNLVGDVETPTGWIIKPSKEMIDQAKAAIAKSETNSL